MTQLSSNTVLYDQIISRVSGFISKYRDNQFADNHELLREYQNLVNQLNSDIGGPLTTLDLYIKGEPPISAKFNAFTKTFAQDINILAKQIDYLSANVVNIFNLFNSEIEQENKFVDRIKNKVKILQMYSSAPANDIFYFGSSFDSGDYINYSKIENKSLLPVVEAGALTLPVVSVSSWTPRQVTVDEENSNGIEGNNHAVYAVDNQDGNTYRYFFSDVNDTRVRSNIIDNNPLKYYEYEQINIKNKPSDAQPFEFKYLTAGQGSQSTQLFDWSTFSSDPLKLTLEFISDVASNANFVKISPYFGNANYISKDIIVRKIEVTDEKNNVENILNQNPIYISSSFIPSSVDSAKNFYYKEANIKFSERKVKRFKIYFEQVESTPVKIQHLYYQPLSDIDSPYKGQLRFNPFAPSTSSLAYPEIPWSTNVSFNLNAIIPELNSPNRLKIEAGASTIPVPVSLQREVPKKTGKTIQISIPNQPNRYINGNFFNSFGSQEQGQFSGITNPQFDATQYITTLPPNTDSPLTTAVAIQDQNLYSELNNIISWFLNDVQISSSSKFQKFDFPEGTSFSVVDINSVDTRIDKFQRSVTLVRRYEVLEAERRSIGIRDISFGYEEYAERAEMISRQFDVSSEIEYLSLSSEVKYSGKINGEVSSLIRYWVTVDNGVNWFELSPIENQFMLVPEVLAFNQNIDNTFKLPGVEYFNQPKVPASIKSFSLKMELTKPNGQNITPMVYSYKVGVKVRQL